MTAETFRRFVRDQALTLGAALSIALLVGIIASRANHIGYFATVRLGSSDSDRRSLGFGVDSGAPMVIFCREEAPSDSQIHYGLGVRNPRASDWSLRVPFSITVPLLCLLPARFAWLYYHQVRRKPPGVCPHCGYDLRASRHRCPECGTETGR